LGVAAYFFTTLSRRIGTLSIKSRVGMQKFNKGSIEQRQTTAALPETRFMTPRPKPAQTANEVQYQALANAMGLGYVVVEADENSSWDDCLFVDANSMFAHQIGLANPIGRRATEFLGTPDPAWAQICGAVGDTGTPVHFNER